MSIKIGAPISLSSESEFNNAVAIRCGSNNQYNTSDFDKIAEIVKKENDKCKRYKMFGYINTLIEKGINPDHIRVNINEWRNIDSKDSQPYLFIKVNNKFYKIKDGKKPLIEFFQPLLVALFESGHFAKK